MQKKEVNNKPRYIKKTKYKEATYFVMWTNNILLAILLTLYSVEIETIITHIFSLSKLRRGLLFTSEKEPSSNENNPIYVTFHLWD